MRFVDALDAAGFFDHLPPLDIQNRFITDSSLRYFKSTLGHRRLILDIEPNNTDDSYYYFFLLNLFLSYPSLLNNNEQQITGLYSWLKKKAEFATDGNKLSPEQSAPLKNKIYLWYRLLISPSKLKNISSIARQSHARILDDFSIKLQSNLNDWYTNEEQRNKSFYTKERWYEPKTDFLFVNHFFNETKNSFTDDQYNFLDDDPVISDNVTQEFKSNKTMPLYRKYKENIQELYQILSSRIEPQKDGIYLHQQLNLLKGKKEELIKMLNKEKPYWFQFRRWRLRQFYNNLIENIEQHFVNKIQATVNDIIPEVHSSAEIQESTLKYISEVMKKTPSQYSDELKQISFVEIDQINTTSEVEAEQLISKREQLTVRLMYLIYDQNIQEEKRIKALDYLIQNKLIQPFTINQLLNINNDRTSQDDSRIEAFLNISIKLFQLYKLKAIERLEHSTQTVLDTFGQELDHYEANVSFLKDIYGSIQTINSQNERSLQQSFEVVSKDYTEFKNGVFSSIYDLKSTVSELSDKKSPKAQKLLSSDPNDDAYKLEKLGKILSTTITLTHYGYPNGAFTIFVNTLEDQSLKNQFSSMQGLFNNVKQKLSYFFSTTKSMAEAYRQFSDEVEYLPINNFPAMQRCLDIHKDNVNLRKKFKELSVVMYFFCNNNILIESFIHKNKGVVLRALLDELVKQAAEYFICRCETGNIQDQEKRLFSKWFNFFIENGKAKDFLGNFNQALESASIDVRQGFSTHFYILLGERNCDVKMKQYLDQILSWKIPHQLRKTTTKFSTISSKLYETVEGDNHFRYFILKLRKNMFNMFLSLEEYEQSCRLLDERNDATRVASNSEKIKQEVSKILLFLVHLKSYNLAFDGQLPYNVHLIKKFVEKYGVSKQIKIYEYICSNHYVIPDKINSIYEVVSSIDKYLVKSASETQFGGTNDSFTIISADQGKGITETLNKVIERIKKKIIQGATLSDLLNNFDSDNTLFKKLIHGEIVILPLNKQKSLTDEAMKKAVKSLYARAIIEMITIGIPIFFSTDQNINIKFQLEALIRLCSGEGRKYNELVLNPLQSYLNSITEMTQAKSRPSYSN